MENRNSSHLDREIPAGAVSISLYKLPARKSAAKSRKSPRTFRESCSETRSKQRVDDGVNRTVVWARLGRPFVSIAVLRQQCLVANPHTSRDNNAFHLSVGYIRAELGSRARLRVLESTERFHNDS